MELEDMVIYKSNVAYHAHKEFIQHYDHEIKTVEAGSYSKNNNKSLNELKTNTELIKIKKLLIAMILLVAILVVTTLIAIIFSALSYRLSRASDESRLDEHIQEKLASLQIQSYCGAGQWHRIAFLNMSDPSQYCPSAWREYNTSGVRA